MLFPHALLTLCACVSARIVIYNSHYSLFSAIIMFLLCVHSSITQPNSHTICSPFHYLHTIFYVTSVLLCSYGIAIYRINSSCGFRLLEITVKMLSSNGSNFYQELMLRSLIRKIALDLHPYIMLPSLTATVL